MTTRKLSQPRPFTSRSSITGSLFSREDHSAPVVSAQAWVRAGKHPEGPWMGAASRMSWNTCSSRARPPRRIADWQEIERKGG